MNPFRFEGPTPADLLIGRGDVVDTLVRNARERRVVSVAAPRRYGKTSVLRAAGEQLIRDHDFVVAHVDLLGLSGPEDFAARFGSAWRRAVADHRRLRRALEGLTSGLAELGVSVLGSGIQVRRVPRQPDAALAVVHALLDLPGDADKPVLVVLDEFQALHPAWPEGEGVLRSHSQSAQQTGQVAYAFAGSQPSLMAAAFADSGRAYYLQALRVPVGRLSGRELAEGLTESFERSGKDPGAMIGPLVTLAAGHPQRAMLLAHLLWDRTPATGPAEREHWDQTLSTARILVADEAVAIWESLSPAQRLALRGVQATGSPTRGAPPGGSRASRQAALAALLRRGLVESSGEGPRGGTAYRLVDPMLGDWLDRR